MVDADLVLIHGFWSSPTTWDRLTAQLSLDPDLAGLRIHGFGYDSPRLPRWFFSPTRISDYNDIAQSLPAYLAAHAPGRTPIVIVTHSQGGLILQRFLAWMLTEGRGRELTRIRAVGVYFGNYLSPAFLRELVQAIDYGQYLAGSQRARKWDGVTGLRPELHCEPRVVKGELASDPLGHGARIRPGSS